MLKIYKRAGWVIIHRKGSHVKVGKLGFRKTIPMHKTLAPGLERKLLKRLLQADTE